MHETVIHLISIFGYIVIALFILLECAGFPLPGETALLVAAAFAGAGKLSISIVIIVAAASAIVGDAGGYWIGRYFGRSIIKKIGKYIGLTEEKIKILEGFFKKYGPITVFFGRFVSILRVYAALFAGISKMRYVTFTIFNALGGIIWATLFGTLGYLFGQSLDKIEKLFRIFGWGALLGLGILGAFWYIRKWVYSSIRLDSASKIKSLWTKILPENAIVYTDSKHTRLSKTSVVVLYCMGLGITVLLIAFLSGTANTLLQYDFLMKIEEKTSIIIDSWLTQRQSLIFIYIAKYGSLFSLICGITTALIFIIIKKRLYFFATLFSLLGSEILNALVAFLFKSQNIFYKEFFLTMQSILLFDNIILPFTGFGMLTYFFVKKTQQILSAISIITGMGILIFVIVASNFLSNMHSGIDFFAELLCAIVWLWICIGLMEIIRIKREREAIIKELNNK
jgi:membrane protein DedA with SNARE-associated domain